MFKVEDVSCIHFICIGHNDYRLLRLFFFFLILDVFGGEVERRMENTGVLKRKKIIWHCLRYSI